MVWYGAVHKHKWTLFVKKYVLNVKAITIQWNRIMESTSIFRRTDFFFVGDYEWFKLKSTLACTCIALVLHYVVFNDVGTGSINIKKKCLTRWTIDAFIYAQFFGSCYCYMHDFLRTVITYLCGWTTY